MMPHCGQIDISYDLDATDGFRLGLMEHLGLTCEAEDPSRDDVVHIDATGNGGILAGSNPRSVLFAVYRFLNATAAGSSSPVLTANTFLKGNQDL